MLSHVVSTVGLDWLAAYLFGALVIVLFARDRMNRPFDAGSLLGRRDRLVGLLVPAQLRRRSIYLRGVVFYSACLLAVYTFVSLLAESFATVFIPPDVIDGFSDMLMPSGTAVTPEDPANNQSTSNMFDSPAWPLFIAATLIGFVPGLKSLDRIEAKFRGLAHELVGVPDSFNDFTDALRSVEIERDALPTALIGPDATKRLDSVLDAAGLYLGGNKGSARKQQHFFNRFEQNVIKLFAYETWASDKHDWPSERVRNEFRQIENAIAPSIAATMQDLEYLASVSHKLQDDLTRVEHALEQEFASEDQRDLIKAQHDDLQQQAHIQNERWRAIYNRVLESVDDTCALFALYAEFADTHPVLNNPISQVLRDLIDRASEKKTNKSTTDAAMITLFLTAAFSFGVGYYGNATQISTSYFSNSYAGLIYAISVTMILGLPTLAVISRRQKLVGGGNGRKWVNAFSGGALFPARQYATLFLRAYFVAVFFIALWFSFQQLTWHIETFGDLGSLDPSCAIYQLLGFNPGFSDASHEQCLERLMGAGLDHEAPGAMEYVLLLGILGATFALSVCLLADLVSAEKDKPHYFALLTICACIGVALVSLGVEEIWISRQTDDVSGVLDYILYISLTFSLITAVTLTVCWRLMRRIREQRRHRDKTKTQLKSSSLIWQSAPATP